MFDIGIPEFLVIAVVGLIVFGPDKLPRAAADAGRLLRKAREAAATARGDLASAVGLDEDTQLRATLDELKDLDPRK